MHKKKHTFRQVIKSKTDKNKHVQFTINDKFKKIYILIKDSVYIPVDVCTEPVEFKDNITPSVTTKVDESDDESDDEISYDEISDDEISDDCMINPLDVL